MSLEPFFSITTSLTEFTLRYSSQWMKYKPADNMTSDFPETYEIFIGLSQCCDNTNCWYYGGPGLRSMFSTFYIIALIQSEIVPAGDKNRKSENRLGTLKKWNHRDCFVTKIFEHFNNASQGMHLIILEKPQKISTLTLEKNINI